jgi:hypothetical protein
MNTGVDLGDMRSTPFSDRRREIGLLSLGGNEIIAVLLGGWLRRFMYWPRMRAKRVNVAAQTSHKANVGCKPARCFYEYEFTPAQIRSFIVKVGFEIVEYFPVFVPERYPSRSRQYPRRLQRRSRVCQAFCDQAIVF